MTRELFWLTLTVILTGLLWVPYLLNRCQVRGLGGAMANAARNDKQHRSLFGVKTPDFAALDLQRTPLPCLRVSGAQPVRRRIVIVAIERVASIGVACLVAGVEISGRSERTPDQRQNVGKLIAGNVQQAGIGPDRVVRLDCIDILKQQRLDRTTETLRGDAGQFRC